MKDYFHLRVSQKGLFGILYFTPSVIGIWNLDDSRFRFFPEFLYRGMDNLGSRLNGSFFAGSQGSKDEKRPNDYRLESRVRYNF